MSYLASKPWDHAHIYSFNRCKNCEANYGIDEKHTCQPQPQKKHTSWTGINTNIRYDMYVPTNVPTNVPTKEDMEEENREKAQQERRNWLCKIITVLSTGVILFGRHVINIYYK
jgi:hypothetical protein